MQYRYCIKYRQPRAGSVGMTILSSAAETAAERLRLEALGYVVIDVSLPIGERPKIAGWAEATDPSQAPRAGPTHSKQPRHSRTLPT